MSLHYQTLEPEPYKLLTELMGNQRLKEAGFVLCGGTALALQMGHRMSTDLDLFTTKNLTAFQIQELMKQTFGNRLEIHSAGDTGFRGFLDGIKIDMIRFPYEMKHPPVEQDGLRLLDLRDGAAMKVHAIANRGLRRDYVDLGELLQKYPMTNVIESYKNQFNPTDSALRHTLMAINYFGDAERTSSSIDIKNGRTWTQTKQIINTSLANPKVIQTLPPSKPSVPINPHLKPPRQTIGGQVLKKPIDGKTAATKAIQTAQNKPIINHKL